MNLGLDSPSESAERVLKDRMKSRVGVPEVLKNLLRFF